MAQTTIKAEQAEGKMEFTYLNRCSKRISVPDAILALEEAETLAMGINIFCDSLLSNPSGLLVEEACEIAFIRAGITGILAKFLDVIPASTQISTKPRKE